MTTLMVTPYAPYRDGIAAYAVQEVRHLRATGVDIEVLSPLPSAAQHHLSLGGVRGVLALAKRAGAYDRLVLQFSPEMLFGACRGPLERVAVWAALWLVARRVPFEIRLHEIEYGPLERNPAERAMAARALRAADTLTVHTQREVDELVRRVGLDAGAVTLVDHGATFVAATALSRNEARAELGLDPAEHVFLAIGFLQEHKGYDRAVDAFALAGLSDRASLHIVGSVRVDHPDLLAYARQLDEVCRATPGAVLHQRYVSDEEFDRWIVAADTVVLPYREIWSSGVLERAKLLQRTVIAADVGGIGDQAPEGTLFFTDTASLADAMRQRAGGAAGGRVRSGPSGGGVRRTSGPAAAWAFDRDEPRRDEIEAAIRRRVRERHLDDGGAGLAGPGSASAVDPLLALGAVPRPPTSSARPGVSRVKRLIRRAIDWELAPLAAHIDGLQRATVEAVATLEATARPGPALPAVVETTGDDRRRSSSDNGGDEVVSN